MIVAHVDRLAPYLGLLGTSSLKEGALLHVGFPWWRDLCALLHFHSNVTAPVA
jgi:hypothetical protein